MQDIFRTDPQPLVWPEQRNEVLVVQVLVAGSLARGRVVEIQRNEVEAVGDRGPDRGCADARAWE